MALRRQYHFRNVGEDTHIWDVTKLVEQSEKLTPIDYDLAAIAEEAKEYWSSEGAKSETHRRLIAQADLYFPILIDPDGRLLDGMHRVEKARAAGHRTIRAIQLDRLPPPDFINVHEDDLDYD